MQTRIQGTVMPVLEIQLGPNESVFAESGELSWMTASIQMTTHTQMGGGGGLLGMFKRVVGGGSFFMTEYRAMQVPGEVAFAARMPGHIVPVPVGPGSEYLVHRHGFLCGTPQVTLSVGFQQSLGAGIFGGDGFMLQKVGGTGTAWLELSGELIRKDLAPGETLRVHPGHVGAFQASVSFQITTVPGIKNAIFGGDGIFLAALTGPGTVWLQTLPISRLAHQIAEYLPNNGSGGARAAGVGGGLLGGIVGSMLNGDNN
ncbi:TIGR00266 family protein [Dyella jejuensis]|uniref:TIGR00266 family protein n=1 Tax=Dyella jejuensis TaxID=1432009 RepID=A0ABW8JH56_9GAMM